LHRKKNFSYEQLFKSAPSDITKPLPVITGWADNEHYLEHNGKLINQITTGNFWSTGIVKIDEKTNTIYFGRAGKIPPD
jgi:hypothetical protein